MGIVPILLLSAAAQLHQMAEHAADAYLSDLHARQPDFTVRIVEVAERSLGTPYANGPLGEGPNGKYDTDPLMDLTRVDCVTFVEQTLALAACSTYKAAFETLQDIRYRRGEVSFEARNHFMIADWIANNTFCRDITRELGAPTASVSRTISRREYFTKVNAPDLGRDAPDKVFELAYVPTDSAASAMASLPSPSLIVFIGKVEWLFALHCGLFIRDGAGNGRLYHASSKAGNVVAVDLLDYLGEQSSRYLGFTAYAIGVPVTEQPPASGQGGR